MTEEQEVKDVSEEEFVVEDYIPLQLKPLWRHAILHGTTFYLVRAMAAYAVATGLWYLAICSRVDLLRYSEAAETGKNFVFVGLFVITMFIGDVEK